MALQVAWNLNREAGVATTIAVAVHELPQELGDFAVLRRAGFATGPLLAANFVASLTCFGGVALAASPWVASRESEMVAFTAGSFLALALLFVGAAGFGDARTRPRRRKGVLSGRPGYWRWCSASCASCSSSASSSTRSRRPRGLLRASGVLWAGQGA